LGRLESEGLEENGWVCMRKGRLAEKGKEKRKERKGKEREKKNRWGIG
jgi:hypothetical protein